MDTHANTSFDVPDVKTRHDTAATGAVLAAMLVSALSGAFVVDVDSTVMLAASAPAPYIAVEETRP
ncbi:MAG TPA: hypothetical protein VM073_01300 [Usitatibacter sp.]|nr:hypothetical protein [Usitatibacter sp.]